VKDKSKIFLKISLKGGGSQTMTCDPTRTDEVAKWLLACIDNKEVAVFKDDGGSIHAALRGDEIAGFGFERGPNIELESKMMDLQIRRLEAEVRQLENMNSGDDWKNNNEDWS
jgi:hypothetical protein